jgi:hypothetical protein
MQCPLCGGPLHLENPDRFVCARGHALAGSELAESTASRVMMAFWMAIEALDSEAEALRILAARDGGSDELASQAAKDAQLLRELASARLTPQGEQR